MTEYPITISNDRHVPIAHSPIDWVDAFLGRWTDKAKHAETIRAYKADLQQLFGEGTFVDHTNIAEFNTLHIRNVLDGYTSARTIRRKLATYSAFFNFWMAQRPEIVLKNPASKYLVNRPGLPDDSHKIKGFIKQEYELLLNVASQGVTGKRDRALIALGTSAALRGRSELAKLRVGNIMRMRSKPFVWLESGKGTSGNAHIPISEEAYDAVMSYQSSMKLPKGSLLWRSVDPERKGKNGKGKRDPEDVISDWEVYNTIKQLVLLAGFDPSFANSDVLRHTCGHMHAAIDVNPERCRVHMRHKKLQTTLIYYQLHQAFESSVIGQLFD